jgi:DNA-binding NarL/FixJ family response regulator
MVSATGSIVLVVEDDEQTREYFVATLEADDTVQRVDKASTFAEGLAHLSADAPDVMLVDLGLPDGSGIDLIRLARDDSPTTLSMVITALGDEASIFAALEAGALGYLLKSEGPDDLRLAVAQLLEGGAPISPGIASQLLRRFTAATGSPNARASNPGLTGREREALELIVKGSTYQEVAEAMSITRHTATSHIRSIYRKLEVRSRSEAVYEAISQGIVRVDERD